MQEVAQALDAPVEFLSHHAAEHQPQMMDMRGAIGQHGRH
jgi:hypothetical protein